MQVICADCKSIYNLTPEQIKGLSFSILPCTTCNRFIKISACPNCNSCYAITFSSAGRNSYQLTCEQCAKPFTIDFPVIKDAERAVGIQSRHNAGGINVHFFKNLFSRNKTRASSHDTRARSAPAVSSFPSSISRGDVFALCVSAFAPLKLLTAAAAVVLSFIMMYGYDRLVSLAFSAGDAVPDAYMKSFLSIIPFALVFFIYIMAAAVIARVTMDEHEPARGDRRMVAMISRSIAPVFIATIILFIAAGTVLILFGLIPAVGPYLFALAFLPVYAISLCVIILIAIGTWFYPPVIAGSLPGALSPILGLLRFIRRHNFRLACILPLMAVITAVAFSAVYLVYYGSFNLSHIMAKTILAEDGDRIFSAIPSSLLQLSDITIICPDSAFFRAYTADHFQFHTAAGFSIGIVFSLISIFLSALFISLIATLSARIYVMMESCARIETASRIWILFFLVLMLAAIYLLKRFIL